MFLQNHSFVSKNQEKRNKTIDHMFRGKYSFLLTVLNLCFIFSQKTDIHTVFLGYHTKQMLKSDTTVNKHASNFFDKSENH